MLLSAALAVAARGPVKISGLVTDENNEPMEFVTVKIGKALGTTTGIDGKGGAQEHEQIYDSA